MRKYFSILLLIFIVSFSFSNYSLPRTATSQPAYENDNIYLGFGFGVRLVNNQVLQTSLPEDQFVVDTHLKFSEQLVIGYDIRKFLGFEGQFTFFPSTVYNLTPNKDSIIRKVYAFSGLLKIMIPMDRLRFYFGGGGSIVYTLAPNFEISVPVGRYSPSDGSNYIDGKWGQVDFFRPEFFVALGYYTSKRVLISLIYSCIFGTGKFKASPVLFSNKDPEFFVEKDYLPDLKLIVFMITMKI